MSLRETQVEFSDRFRVTPVTIHNWESGKTRFIQKIHREILDKMVKRLKQDGMYLPEEVMTTIYRENVERKGNALI